MSGILEQAVVMLRETLLAKGGAVDGAQLLAGQEGNDGLQQVLAMALMQFFSGGKMPPGMMPGMPGGMPSEPEATPPPPPGVEVRPPTGSKPGAGVRFEFDARAKKPKAGAVADSLVKAIRKLFGSMDGMQLLAMTSALGESHYESFGAVRVAKSDAEAARAVAVMQCSGGWEVLRENLGDAGRPMLMEIEALARQHASPAPSTASAPSSAQGESEQPLVKSVRRCMGAMDGDQAMALMNLLSARERMLLEAVRVAETDDEAAKAVLVFGEALSAGDVLSELSAALSEDERLLFQVIHMQAVAHVEEPEDEAGPEVSNEASPSVTKPARSPEKVEAVLCLAPPETECDGGPLMEATRAWLKGMDGEEGMALLGGLTPKQREAIQGIRTAKTEDDVSQAVLAFQVALQRSANWMGLVGRLSQEKIQRMMQIWAMAEHHRQK